MNLAWLLYGYQAILFWVGLPIAIFLLLWWIDRKNAKLHTSSARYPIIGRWVSSRALSQSTTQVFAVHSCCLLQKDRLDPRVLKNIW